MADKTPRPILTKVEPHVFVTDFERSLAFYVDVLGFTVAFTYGDPPFFGQVVRDAAALNLRLVHHPVLDRSRQQDFLSVTIIVSDARALFLELQASGAPINQPLRRQPWHEAGQGDFVVEDPDGNLIHLVGPTT